MPNRDGTGPEGKGALTGKKLGKCAGASPCPRRNGPRFGRGQGMGRRNLDN